MAAAFTPPSSGTSSSFSTAGPSSSPSPSVPSPNEKINLRASHHLLSGALSGFSSAIVLQPLDLLKTRLQQSGPLDSGSGSGAGSGSASAQAQAGLEGGAKRRRLAPVVRQVLAEDGVRGLWRGTVPTLVRNVPGVAIYFYSLSSIRNKLSASPYFATAIPLASSSISTSPSAAGGPGRKHQQRSAIVKLSSTGNLVAGAIARTSVGFVLSPITVIKARFESNRYAAYHSIPDALRSLWRSNGLRGLYQGFTATAARDAPYAGLYLVFYEKGKDLVGRISGVPNAALHSSSGVMAAVLATVVTSPADVIKTRMQVNPGDHPTIRKAIGKVLLDRGAIGFFSGTSLRISRKAASSAIGWTVYEGLLLFLREREALGLARKSGAADIKVV